MLSQAKDKNRENKETTDKSVVDELYGCCSGVNLSLDEIRAERLKKHLTPEAWSRIFGKGEED